MSILSRLLNRWRERSLAAEADAEIRFHLESRVDANIRRGMGRAEAEAEARRRFGNLSLAREDMRLSRVARWPDDLLRDVRHAGRLFRRQPALTALTILALSLGIGANAAIFSLLNAALFRPLPFPDADRLIAIVDGTSADLRVTSPTIPELLDVRAWTKTLDGVSFFDTRDAQIDGGSEPARVLTARVEPAFLALVGARPALGRLFGPTDGGDGSDPVVILSDGLWRRNFGGDDKVTSRSLMVNGESHRIVGVLDPAFSIDFFSSEPIEMYVPYPMIPAYTSRAAEFAGVRRVFGIGRTKPGVSMASAASELASIGGTLARQYPDLYRSSAAGGEGASFVMDARPLRDSVGSGNRNVLLMVFGAVVLVLVIACVNAAQFLLAQAAEREPEVALRRALGAARGRLVRQFLSEALLVAGVAGGLGLLQAFWLVGVVRALLAGTRVIGPVDIDARVLAFTVGVAVVTALACGLVPGLRFSRVDPRSTLDLRGSTGARGRSRHVLVAVEVAISVVLLLQAGLLLRSLQILQRAHRGFSTEAVTTMRIRGMAAGGPSLGMSYRQYLDRIGTVPDVEAAAVSSAILPGRPGTPFAIIGRPEDAAARSRQNATFQIVSPRYFSVLRIPIIAGRTFSDADTAAAPAVAVVNEELVRQYWPDSDPIGHGIHSGAGPREATFTIVGVVGNVRPTFQTGDVPQIYVSYLQQSEPNMIVMLRAAQGRTVSIEAVKSAIWSVEARQAVFSIRALDEVLSQSVQGQRVVAMLVTSFALLSFVISVAGVFTVVSYLTARRVKEIALRRAVGANHADVMWLLAGQTLRWSIAGLVVGVAGAFVASQALRAAVTGIVRLDASIVSLIAAGYLLAVVVAMALPARRALRVDPAAALRLD